MSGVSKITGRMLVERWGIGARHALYRESGAWYHPLERFPGALCDGGGYILFPTREAFERCPGVFIGKGGNWLSIPGGIASLPGYVRRAHWVAERG
jgi:hypothetical protein